MLSNVQKNIIATLSQCRGQRCYGASLLSCLGEGEQTERRLHNVCAALFRRQLIEKQRGMYALTELGKQVAKGHYVH